MISLARRLVVPLTGAFLVLVVIVVAFVALDLGGAAGDSSGLTPIRIGSAPADQEAGVAVPSLQTTVTSPDSSPSRPESVSGSGPASDPHQGSASIQVPGGTSGTGSTIRTGKSTVVTSDIRVQPGTGQQGGTAGGKATTSTLGASVPSTAGAQGTSTTGGAHVTSTAGGGGPSTTGGPAGSPADGSGEGAGGPAPTGQGR